MGKAAAKVEPQQSVAKQQVVYKYVNIDKKNYVRFETNNSYFNIYFTIRQIKQFLEDTIRIKLPEKVSTYSNYLIRNKFLKI